MSSSLRNLIDDAYINGKYTYTAFRKVSPLVSTAGMFVDLSMATGYPTPNYYLGNELTATVPTAWYKKGIWHGGAVSPDKKILHKVNLLGTNAVLAPAPYILCDYLMYYPLIDMDNTNTQDLTNYGTIVTATTDPSAAVLPRYTNGVGVKAFLVATNPYIGGAKFYITYTNSASPPVSGRISQICTTNIGGNIATIVNSNTAIAGKADAFIELQAGDTGITSVQSITFVSPNGGLAALVLCKPIANLMTYEANTCAEFDFIKDKPSIPRIYDGAYLNFLVMPSGSIATIPLVGEVTTIWAS